MLTHDMSTLKNLDPLAPENVSSKRLPSLTPREFIATQCHAAQASTPTSKDTDWIPASALYAAYTQYCRRHDLKPVTGVRFYKTCGLQTVNSGKARCFPLVLTDSTLRPLKTTRKRGLEELTSGNASAESVKPNAELDGPSVARVFKLLAAGKAPREVVAELELPAALVASAAEQYSRMGPPPTPPKEVKVPTAIACRNCGQHQALHCTACKQNAPKPCTSCNMTSEVDLCVACLVGLEKDRRSKPGHILFKVRSIQNNQYVTVYDFKIPSAPKTEQEQAEEEILRRLVGNGDLK